MKRAYLQILFILCAGFMSAQTTKVYQLPATLKYIDKNNDDELSDEECKAIFNQYFENRGSETAELTVDVESSLIDLIGFLEGADLRDIKNTKAARRFIEIYYNRRYYLVDQTPFGIPPIVAMNDTVALPQDTSARPFNQTEFFDQFMHVEGHMTSVFQMPMRQTLKNFNGQSDLSQSWNREMLIMATLPFYFTPWKNGVLNITPEYSGGNGLGDGAGLAGYPNALYAFPQAKPYLLRAQFQQQIVLKKFEDGTENTIEFSAGRFILQEMFEMNQWSGNPKKDFLNFNHTMMSAWDAATTAYGYTHGVAARYRGRNTIISGALVTVNDVQGGPTTDWNIAKGNSINLQYCRALKLADKDFNIRVLGFRNTAYSGAWKDLVTDTAITSFEFPDSLKSYHSKMGIGIDADIALDKETGIFFRYSINDGKSETMGYTQADVAFNLGISKGMSRIRRPNDCFGFAWSLNGISKGHQDYINAGGNGFMIAGGPITYGREMVFETYYRLNLFANTDISLNYQVILNPAYNKDNCMVDALACRLHFEF
jgi:high affinity Mn2+ porin